MKRLSRRVLDRVKRVGEKAYGKVRDIRPPEVLAHEELERVIRPGRALILYVAIKYDYGDKSRGLSAEHFHFYSTLIRMDYSIIYFDYDRITKKFGRKKASQILREAVYYYQPEFLVYSHFLDQIDKAVWKEISEELSTTTIIVLADDYARYEETRPVWELFNVIVTMDHHAAEKRKKEKFTNSFLSQFGFNHFIYRDLRLPKVYDVSFVGQAHGVRPKVIALLRDEGVRIHTFGRGWPGSGRVSQVDLLRIYNQSKISFNHAFGSRGSVIVNGREFEVPGCGGFLLTQEYQEIHQYYTVGKEIITYKDIKNAAEKIKYYLAHDREREAIAKAGHERALRDHTYEKRFHEIFAFADTVKK